MLDIALVLARLKTQSNNPLRDIRISANLDEAMKNTVQTSRAWLMDLGDSLGRNATGSAQVSQVVQAEFGVLFAVPDLGRDDQQSVLYAPRAFVRKALIGWAPDGVTAIEGRRGRLMAAGPVLWWLDTYGTEYIESGA